MKSATPVPPATEAATSLGAGIAALALATIALVFGPILAVASLVAVVAVVGIIEDSAFGAIAVAAFVILQIPDIATDFHGAPSTFAPLLALVLVALAARSIRSGTWPAGGGRAAVVVGVVVGVALISITASGTIGTGLPAVAELTKDGAVAVVIGLLVRSTNALRLVVWTLVGGGMFLAGLSILQFLTGSFGSTFGGFAQSEVHQIVGALDDVRISGPLEDANFYAQWMVMLIPLAIDRFYDETWVPLRATALGAAAMSAAVVVLTFSRGGLLALVVVLALMALRHPPRPAAIAAAVVAAIVVIPFLPTGYTDRLLELTDIGETEIGSDPSIRAREAEAIAATEMFLDHPLTGVGYGGYPDHYPEYVRDLGIEQTGKAREAHNLYLETAAETGVLGVFALSGVVIAVGASLRSGRRRLRAMGDMGSDGIGYAVGVALIGYLITSVFLHMAFSRPMWLLAGLALALPSMAAAEDSRRDRELEAAW